MQGVVKIAGLDELQRTTQAPINADFLTSSEAQARGQAVCRQFEIRGGNMRLRVTTLVSIVLLFISTGMEAQQTEPTVEKLHAEYDALSSFDVPALEQKAMSGDPRSQVLLAMANYEGRVMQENVQEGLRLFRVAAEQGYWPAQRLLGEEYYLGKAVRQDYAEAMKWFLKAAEQGSAPAQSNVGVMYAQGEGPQRTMCRR